MKPLTRNDKNIAPPELELMESMERKAEEKDPQKAEARCCAKTSSRAMGCHD